jgi:hypothetical protein
MSRLYSTVHVEDGGAYAIAAVKDGTYDLKAHAPEHVEMKITIEMTDRDESKTVDFPLGSGIEQVVEFVWSGGQPVGGSTVVEGTARDGHNPERIYSTDAAGRLRLRMAPGERRTLVILPREGSFAIAEISAPEKPDAAPLQVVVPPPAGSLRVKIDWKGKPATFGAMAMRYNGRDLPASAILRLPVEPVEGGGSRYRNLPAGAYEIWIPGGTAARVGLTAGEESVELAARP